ncbi:hypothetical protein [Rhizobium phage RHEph15]|uniref:Uncharacterized protein n=2 Tax=Tepoztlanvirus TaxID=3424906 RepID=A0A7S5QYL6_9CAUD|nr:hypothetical protein EVB35_010 [Rhizobium phage RHph_TM34]QIG68287.1 hypothetical protein EVB57_010 [Rhizobium phage RHph_Y1_20]QIG69955.1 hypothetical protein EVB84_011 [Rhizobium phage RHph_Y48]QIG70007.1 hypothetical protein EVB85_011 [Rhizobium phage RHph_Y86]QIG70059.1 hypothetical protein EVB86_011 [Rhizobium phage RHph_Y2_7]QXV74271.1 hypothetical protein [Rhizobium phage RHEph15]QXV74965.1 hypothetical protein [Rhizobium phage RHEph27]
MGFKEFMSMVFVGIICVVVMVMLHGLQGCASYQPPGAGLDQTLDYL